MYSGRHTPRAYITKRRSVPAHARACVETRILVDQLASVIDSPPANLVHLCDDLDIWRNFVISVTIMTAAFSTPELAEDASKEFAENSADVILLLSSIVTQLTTEAYEKRQNMTLQKTVRRVTSLQHFTKKSFIRQGSLDLPDACSVTDTIQKEAIASLRCVQQMRRSPSPIHTDSVLKSVAPDDSAALQDPQTFWDEVSAFMIHLRRMLDALVAFVQLQEGPIVSVLQQDCRSKIFSKNGTVRERLIRNVSSTLRIRAPQQFASDSTPALESLQACVRLSEVPNGSMEHKLPRKSSFIQLPLRRQRSVRASRIALSRIQMDQQSDEPSKTSFVMADTREQPEPRSPLKSLLSSTFRYRRANRRSRSVSSSSTTPDTPLKSSAITLRGLFKSGKKASNHRDSLDGSLFDPASSCTSSATTNISSFFTSEIDYSGAKIPVRLQKSPVLEEHSNSGSAAGAAGFLRRRFSSNNHRNRRKTIQEMFERNMSQTCDQGDLVNESQDQKRHYVSPISSSQSTVANTQRPLQNTSDFASSIRTSSYFSALSSMSSVHSSRITQGSEVYGSAISLNNESRGLCQENTSNHPLDGLSERTTRNYSAEDPAAQDTRFGQYSDRSAVAHRPSRHESLQEGNLVQNPASVTLPRRQRYQNHRRSLPASLATDSLIIPEKSPDRFLERPKSTAGFSNATFKHWMSANLPKIETTSLSANKRSCQSSNIGHSIVQCFSTSSKQNDHFEVQQEGRTVLIMERQSEGKYRIIAGTLSILLHQLIQGQEQDINDIDIFILNHHFFTTPMQVMDELHSLAFNGSFDWLLHEKRRFFRSRIIYLLSRWLNLRPEDFSTENQSFRAKLELFLDQLHARAGFAEEVRKLRYMLNHQAAKQREAMMSKSGTELISMIFNAVDTQGRRKSSPGSFSKQSMNMFDALHVAQYLTLADYKLFKNIAETEYLTCSQTNDANVHVGAKALLTKRSNTLSHWVVHELCSQGKNKRSATLTHLIKIAKYCLEWNAFHTSMVIVIGLQNPLVQRMDVWQTLSKQDLSTFEELQKLIDLSNNMRYYRQALATKTSPAIPFLPVVTKDITFFLEGNTTYLHTESAATEDCKLVNLQKFRSITDFITSLKKYTMAEYPFACNLRHTSPLYNVAMVLEKQFMNVEPCLGSSTRCEIYHFNTLETGRSS